MATGVEGVPDESAVVIPRLFCRDPGAEIDFLVRTFEAAELGRRPGPDGGVAHALLTIGPAMVMIEAEWPSLPVGPSEPPAVRVVSTGACPAATTKGR